MDLVWLVIPAAVAFFVLRALVIARKLKASARTPALMDARALREAKESLQGHREHLSAAVSAPKAHLAAAKDLPRIALARPRAPKGLDAMVEDFLPERRL